MSDMRSEERELQELAGEVAAWLSRQSQLGLRSLPRRAHAEMPSKPVSRDPKAPAATGIDAVAPPEAAKVSAPFTHAPVQSSEQGTSPDQAIGLRVEAFSQSVSQLLSPVRPVAGSRPRASTLSELRTLLGDCERCGLCRQRNRLVFGEGASRPRVMFVGDMPTADEDASGQPLAGAEGELLRKMLQAMKLPEEQVYVTSVVKCRSVPARRPHPDEVKRCLPVLSAQIRISEPEVIVVLGGAALAALKPDETLTAEDRGRWMELSGVPMMPTFHPALLLQKPDLKKAAWQDLQQVMKRLGLS